MAAYNYLEIRLQRISRVSQKKEKPMIQRILLVTFFLSLMTLTVFAGGEGEETTPPLPEGYESVTSKGIAFQWKVEDQSLRVRVAAATTGWIAVGFDPSSRMKDANIIIGYVQEGEVFLSDGYGVGNTSHDSDESLGGSSDVSDVQGSEENGNTFLSFTIPLDSGDEYDRVLEAGNSYRIILATGGQDNFSSYHGAKRTGVTVTL
jgi:hypothetical protein